MRSGVPEGDRTTRSRILQAAIRCTGTGGPGVSVRAIAAEAGVSPALVIHHFGSRRGLRAECDAAVLAAIQASKDDSLRSAPAEVIARLAAVEEFAPVVAYLVQTLLAGGDFATTFLDALVADTEVYLERAVAAGEVRPSRDPPARARWLVLTSVGALLLHVRRHAPPGGDVDVGWALQEYGRTAALPALELYTEGLLTGPGLLDALVAGTPPETPETP